MRARTLLIVFAVTMQASSAKDLGVIGPVYRIAEPDLLQTIEATLRAKAQSGELALLQQAAQRRARAALETPEPVAGVSRTATPRRFYFDPSVSFPENVVDDQGKIIVAAGTTHNPLEVITMSKHLLFFDARDRAQVAQARGLINRYQGRVKPILVAGSYMGLMRTWKEPVYYDQHGALTRQLGITQVPALVSQEGRRLRIDELAVP